jgi:very-short-patch-repair endonuclease
MQYACDKNFQSRKHSCGFAFASAPRESRSFADNTRWDHTSWNFYCPKARLAIEVDGMIHDTGDRPQRDLQRDAWLKEHAVTVFRLAAADVLRGVDETADGIVRLAADLSSQGATGRESFASGE